MPCSSLVDLGTIAQNYGQMTGVLAGFAFTALVLLLTPTQSDRRLATGRHGQGVPLAFFVSFITLVIATLMYSVLAGEHEEARSRAATAELVDGVTFGLAVLILLRGVSLLMHNAGIETSAVVVSRMLTTVIVPALAMYLIAQGASDTEAARNDAAGRGCWAPGPVLGVWLTAILVVILSGSLLPAVQRLANRFTSVFRVAAPLTVFVSAVSGAVISGNISTRSPNFLMSPFTLRMFLIGTFLLFLVVGLMLAFSDPAESAASQTAESKAGVGKTPGSDAGQPLPTLPKPR
jgi:hypothetical protein